MTTTAITDSQNFDITPDPRVLQMLGEIDLAQWRCIAELVDNSVDGFLNADNDLAEELDCSVIAMLRNGQLPNPRAPLHSESPGLMIDRLSILALKIYHTREETERDDAPVGHTERNRVRLAILAEQRNDLAECLDTLWNETLSGLRRFKIYRQLKMYNDPALNPKIYRAPRGN